MRFPAVALLGPFLLAPFLLTVGCATKSDSLYQPASNTVSTPGSAALGDELDQDREALDEAGKAREESLRLQRENADDDNNDD